MDGKVLDPNDKDFPGLLMSKPSSFTLEKKTTFGGALINSNTPK